MKVKTAMILAWILALPALAVANAIPCAGQPPVLCAKAAKMAAELAKRNFISFGLGERRIFRGDFHTIDSDGKERSGPALGKNMWFSLETTRLRGINDEKQYVTVATNDTSKTVTFSMVVDRFYGFAHLGFSDPRMRVTLRPLGGMGWNRLTFDELEAKDIPISHIPGVGTGGTGRLKQIAVRAVPSPTLMDLIDASIVPSFALRKGADLDLAAEIASGNLQVGPTDAVLRTRDSFIIRRADMGQPFKVDGVIVPESELPPECHTLGLGKVTFEADINIPIHRLSGTFVQQARPKVERCWKLEEDPISMSIKRRRIR